MYLFALLRPALVYPKYPMAKVSNIISKFLAPYFKSQTQGTSLLASAAQIVGLSNG